MSKQIRIVTVAILVLATLGCRKASLDSAKFPGTKDGARALLGEFLNPGADLKNEARLRTGESWKSTTRQNSLGEVPPANSGRPFER